MNAVDPIKSLDDIRKMKNLVANLYIQKQPLLGCVFEKFYLFPIQKSLTGIIERKIKDTLSGVFYGVGMAKNSRRILSRRIWLYGEAIRGLPKLSAK